MGTGGAPEGVLAAAALRCLGAEILGPPQVPRTRPSASERRMGVVDDGRVYRTDDLARRAQDVRFVATGVTDGDLLPGVRFFAGGARTHSLVMSVPSRTIRFVDAVHVFDPRVLGSVRIA